EPFLEIVAGLSQRFSRGQRLRLREQMSWLLEQNDAVTHNVHEEITAEPQLLVHIIQAVIDEADGRPQVLARRNFLKQLLLGFRPEFRNVGELLAIDDD